MAATNHSPVKILCWPVRTVSNRCVTPYFSSLSNGVLGLGSMGTRIMFLIFVCWGGRTHSRRSWGEFQLTRKESKLPHRSSSSLTAAGMSILFPSTRKGTVWRLSSVRRDCHRRNRPLVGSHPHKQDRVLNKRNDVTIPIERVTWPSCEGAKQIVIITFYFLSDEFKAVFCGVTAFKETFKNNLLFILRLFFISRHRSESIFQPLIRFHQISKVKGESLKLFIDMDSNDVQDL